MLVPVQKTCIPEDTQPSSGPRALINVEVIGDPLDQHVKGLEREFHHKALAEEKEGLEAELRKRNTLIKDIATTEAHIESLQSGLRNWSALTDDARKMLGKYHTQDDIRRTLTRQEMVLCLLKTEVNCTEYKIERFRRGENHTQAPTCIAKA